MPPQLSFRRDARVEFRAATRRYEAARAGLGLQFVAEVEAALHRIVMAPLRFAPVYQEVRRALVTRFPYAIFFRVYENRIRIISVFHTSRDPAVWQERADEEAD